MIDIYISELPRLVNNTFVDKIVTSLSADHQNNIKRLHNLEDKLRSSIGVLLLNYILINRMKIKEKNIVIKRDVYGKPYLTDYKNIEFNISHSGNKVVCVVNKEPMGIDIEHMVKINVDEIVPLLTLQEQTLLNRTQEPESRLKLFYYLWTIKESYLKAKGNGFSLSQESYQIEEKIDEDNLIINEKGTDKNFFCKHIDINDNYSLAFCTSSFILSYKLNYIGLDKFL